MHLTTSNESQVASLIRNVVFVVAAVAAAIAFKVNNVAYAQCANMAIWVLRIRRVSRSTASSSANCAYAWRMQRRAALCSESASAAAVAGPGQLAGFSSRSSRALRDPLLTLPVIVPTVQTVGAMRFDLNRPVQRLSQALVVATLFLSLSFFLLALFPLSLSLSFLIHSAIFSLTPSLFSLCSPLFLFYVPMFHSFCHTLYTPFSSLSLFCFILSLCTPAPYLCYLPLSLLAPFFPCHSACHLVLHTFYVYTSLPFCLTFSPLPPTSTFPPISFFLTPFYSICLPLSISLSLLFSSWPTAALNLTLCI